MVLSMFSACSLHLLCIFSSCSLHVLCVDVKRRRREGVGLKQMVLRILFPEKEMLNKRIPRFSFLFIQRMIVCQSVCLNNIVWINATTKGFWFSDFFTPTFFLEKKEKALVPWHQQQEPFSPNTHHQCHDLVAKVVSRNKYKKLEQHMLEKSWMNKNKEGRFIPCSFTHSF